MDYIGLLLQCAAYIFYIGRPARSSKFLQQAVHPMVKPPRTQVTVQGLQTAGELGLPDCRGSWEAGLRLVRCQSWDDHSGIGRPRQVTSDGAALEEGGSWSGEAI